MLMSMTQAGSDDHSGVASETMSMSKACTIMMLVACAAAKDCVDVHGLFYHWRPWWGQCYLLMPETMWMSVAQAVTKNHVEVHDACSYWLKRKLHLLWCQWLQTHSWWILLKFGFIVNCLSPSVLIEMFAGNSSLCWASMVSQSL